MKLPFPNSQSRLALNSHMYICLRRGSKKIMVKCQTARPTHLLSNKPPFKYVSESADITRNPFTNTTLVDCDKTFSINDVEIDASLLTTIRKDICHPLFVQINSELQHPNCGNELINTSDLLALNHLIRQI